MEGSSYMGNEVLDSKEGCESHVRKVLGLDYVLSLPQLKLGLNSHCEIIRRWKFHSTEIYRSKDLCGGRVLIIEYWWIYERGVLP